MLVALVLAGCGSSPEQTRTAPTAAPAAATGPSPCMDEISKLIGGAVQTSVKDVSPGQATCAYRSGHVRVDVQVDTNPQAEFRFERAVVERGQNAVWGHDNSKAPVQLHGLGIGADWFPADRELLTTDGKQLISVLLVHGGTLHLSRAVARAQLST